MTKIYLVKFNSVGEKNEKKVYAYEAFTNKKKALQYKRYWDAHTQLTPTFKGDYIEIEELQINNLDYTERANKEEMKLLPY